MKEPTMNINKIIEQTTKKKLKEHLSAFKELAK